VDLDVSSCWHDVVKSVGLELSGSDYWQDTLLDIGASRSMHLAVFVDPFLSYVLDGKKTIESRFSKNRIAPFGRVREGDIMLLKRSGGPVAGMSVIDSVWTYRLDPSSWADMYCFADAMCARESSFWSERSGARYATLMRLGRTTKLREFRIRKRDRRSWVVIVDACGGLFDAR
jgi:hypothetical protein